ncbi:MAG: hypothetical protein U0Q19_21235 [Kineosporiaceae bacterium]
MVTSAGGPFADWLASLTGVTARAGARSVRATTSGALIVTTPDLVIKLHHPRTDHDLLATRLRLAASPALAAIVLAPVLDHPLPVPAELAAELVGAVGDAGQDAVGEAPGGWRWASLWPRVEVLAPDAADDVHLPWRAAGRLLAGLHLAGVPHGAPPGGAGERLPRALARIAAHPAPDAAVVRAAGRAVAEALADAATGLCGLAHGDWHLGQLGRRSGTDPWLLIDLDDLGLGPAADDLARPAGFWACGLLADAAWAAFVEGYRDGGGPALAPSGDPWPVLELPARAAVVVAAARAVLDGPLEGTGRALVEACRRMPTTGTPVVGTLGAARVVVQDENSESKETR